MNQDQRPDEPIDLIAFAGGIRRIKAVRKGDLPKPMTGRALLTMLRRKIRERMEGFDVLDQGDSFHQEFTVQAQALYRVSGFDFDDTLRNSIVMVAEHVIHNRFDFSRVLYDQSFNILADDQRRRRMEVDAATLRGGP